jgi:hypothetical protein
MPAGSRSHDAVDLRHLLHDLEPVALGETPGDDQRATAPVLLELGRLQDRVDGFLARAVDEGAGVDDDALGVLGALAERETGLAQHPQHQLGVDLVLGHPSVVRWTSCVAVVGELQRDAEVLALDERDDGLRSSRFLPATRTWSSGWRPAP